MTKITTPYGTVTVAALGRRDRDALRDLLNAADDRAFAGAQPPEDRDGIRLQYEQAIQSMAQRLIAYRGVK